MEKKVIKISFKRCLGSRIVKIGDFFFDYTKGTIFIKIPYGIIRNIDEIIRKYLSVGVNRVYYNTNISYPLTRENILKTINDRDDLNYLVLEKDFVLSEIQEFFEFQISIQINGEEIKSFYPLMKDTKTIDEDIVTFVGYVGHEHGRFGKLGATADALFGPRYKTESEIFINDFRVSEEYRKHISEIEKIFLTKEFRNAKNIGTDKEYEFNGKIERLELDLRNPDMEVYEKMKAIDNCIEIEWE